MGQLRNLDLDALRRHVALVHRAEVIPATVLENLSLSRLNVTEEDAFEALRAVGLLEEVLALPEGVNTALSHHGSPLQPERILRLALARAIVGRPRLLLLHEVFDHIDPSLVPAVADHLLKPGSPWTAVISTQNPVVLAHCNRICRLEAGRLSEVAPVRPGGTGHG